MPHPAMTGPEIGNRDHEHCRDTTAVSWSERVGGIFEGVNRMYSNVVPSPHKFGRDIKTFAAECNL
jgi:hypothetical protein